MTTDNPTENTALPWSNGLYSIKRYGTTLTRCDSEPVQTPGCIQAHGAMLVLRLSDLSILQASENTAQFFDTAPEQLLGQSIKQVVGAENAVRLREVLEQELVEHNAIYAFTLPQQHDKHALDVSVHSIEGVAILEFEVTGRADTNNKNNDDFFIRIKSAVNHLQGANSLREFCQRVTDEVRSMTELDRVMIYRFHADHHGEVIGESKRDDLAPWLGFHYPEGDIPKPAREIFKRIWIRPLPNAAGPLVELVPLANPDTGKALNMTYCALRIARCIGYVHRILG